jgi:hypothetical protein
MIYKHKIDLECFIRIIVLITAVYWLIHVIDNVQWDNFIFLNHIYFQYKL